MKRSLVVLSVGTLALWLAVAWPARLVWGDAAVLFTAVAAVVCLVPALATLAWGLSSIQGSPQQRLAAVLGGTGLRMMVVLGLAVALFLSVPELGQPAFLVWVIVFYLATLALEVLLLVRHLAAIPSARAPGASQDGAAA